MRKEKGDVAVGFSVAVSFLLLPVILPIVIIKSFIELVK